ncbi:hypothetical protein ACFWOG_35805, partial [Kitasatospora sp. NPDC058406]|uniref:hypothetical protein n=1 Tax=Kitasatospora sp. NPDC058406 TaxID=3346483 RepID=UPI0036696F72
PTERSATGPARYGRSGPRTKALPLRRDTLTPGQERSPTATDCGALGALGVPGVLKAATADRSQRLLRPGGLGVAGTR